MKHCKTYLHEMMTSFFLATICFFINWIFLPNVPLLAFSSLATLQDQAEKNRNIVTTLPELFTCACYVCDRDWLKTQGGIVAMVSYTHLLPV